MITPESNAPRNLKSTRSAALPVRADAGFGFELERKRRSQLTNKVPLVPGHRVQVARSKLNHREQAGPAYSFVQQNEFDRNAIH